MATSDQLSYLSHGWEASNLAEKAHLVAKRLSDHRERSLTRLARYQDTREVPSRMMIVFWLMAAGWLLTAIVELLVSLEMYVVAQSAAEGSVGPVLTAFSIALWGVFCSGLLAEIVHPTYSKYYSKPATNQYRRAIMSRNQKAIDWKYAYFTLGVILTAGTTWYLYTLSQARVALESQAGGVNGDFVAVVWMPAVLYIFECGLGISLPYVFSSLQYRYVTSSTRRKDVRLERRHEELVTKSLESYAVSVIEREESDSTVPPAPVSKNLKALIESRFGEKAVAEEAEAPVESATDSENSELTNAVEDTATEPDTSQTEANDVIGNSIDETEFTDDDTEEIDAVTRRLIDSLIEKRSSEL